MVKPPKSAVAAPRNEKNYQGYVDVRKFEGSKVDVKLWTTPGIPIDQQTENQLRNVSKLPFIHKHIAVMPDAHLGKGGTVGSVIPTKGVIIPATVGVDIGCGMCAVRTSLKASDLPDNLSKIRLAMEQAIPHGGPGEIGSWSKANGLPKKVADTWNQELGREFGILTSIHPHLEKKNSVSQLGTLGTGNHFVELCLDENDAVWAMLHSGSRGIGNAIGTYFIEQAKREMQKLDQKLNVNDKDLSYLTEGTKNFDNYVAAVSWAQKFARLNRKIMMDNFIGVLKGFFPDITVDIKAINCHHNYVNEEEHFGEKVWVSRKGAVSARKGELGIIPGSMGAKTFIVRGKGNKESFHSCSHGAGRLMSRTQAKAHFTLEDHLEATKGIECRKDLDVIDETPGAYKDIEMVMAAQTDLVEIVHTLRQVICVKG